ncbi:MAG: hypothetical protein IPL73_23945 [Candidatus Obscuribacter sp.]|nr:hypothetical protein [Candidatus Obscuribacter sp.]
MPDVISKSLLERVNQALQDGEKLLWTGQPDPGVMVRKERPAIFVCLFVTLGMVPISIKLFFKHFEQDELVVKAIAVAIVLVPLFLTYCVVFWARMAALATVYAVTNKRALIFEPNKLVEFNVITSLDVTSAGAGRADLVFENLQLQGRSGFYNKPIGFFGVNDGDNVETILAKTFEPARVRHNPAKESDTWNLN